MPDPKFVWFVKKQKEIEREGEINFSLLFFSNKSHLC